MYKKTDISALLIEAGINCNQQQVDRLCRLCDAVEAVFGCTFDDLKSGKRGEILSYARRAWFWYAKDILPQITAGNTAKLLNKTLFAFQYSIKMFKDDMHNNKFQTCIEKLKIHYE